MLILGAIAVAVLFAALVGPYFIDWDNYRATFEAEASRILGQPVKVAGKADARLLPYPSVTFENVEIGDREGRPMMTVDKVSADLELFPLLQGEIHVVAMEIARPRATVTIDDSGALDWLLAGEDAARVDPGTVTLAGVEISDGVLVYDDPSNGIQREFRIGHASVEAGSLAGPWRVEGTYSEGGGAGTFAVTTGRSAAAGLRAKVEITPPDQPVTYSADGIVTASDAGLSYAGTFATEAVIADAREGEPSTGWRSEGTFTLTRKQLLVDKAVLSFGAEDQPTSLAGSLKVDFGKDARFSADLQSRQLDLDHLLGVEPNKPVPVGEASARLMAALVGFQPPAMPGSVGFNVTAVVVGGSIIQDLRFRASAAPGGWQVAGLHAKLPGQATVDADGLIATGDNLGFSGRAALKVPQPAAFAAWWRGRRDPAAALLPPFEIAGRARIEPGRIAFDQMNASIGGANIAGAIAWSDANAAHPRLIETDVSANRLDFGDIKSLAELLAGREIGDANAFADSYNIKLKADEVAIDDVLVRNVSIDAGYIDGSVSVKKIDIGDIGGAHLTATEGEITDAFGPGDPRGRLVAHLDATTLTGLARLIDRVQPGSRVAAWLASATPALVPLILDGSIEAPPRGLPEDKVRLKLFGSAGATKVDASLDLTGKPSAWASGATALQLDLSSYNAVNLLEQAGLVAAGSDHAGSASLRVAASGVPVNGMPTTIDGSLAGIALRSAGVFAIPKEGRAGYAGDFELTSDDLMPLAQMSGVTIPTATGAVALSLKGRIDTALGDVTIADSAIAGHPFRGAGTVGRGADGIWQVYGNLSVHDLDLPWLAGLGFGAPFARTEDPSAPWSRAPFAAPPIAHIAGRLELATERMTIAPGLEIANPRVTLSLAPDRVEVALAGGEIAGGTAEANLAIHNVDGNAGFAGNFQLKGVALDRFIWQRAGRAIATGKLDLSANVEGTGRSPAGLVATLTGGGTVLISEGELRYLNQRAAALVVRASDNGKLYDNDALRDDFAGYIDAGTFPFGSTGGAFSVAAGTVRLDNLTLAAGDTTITGGGTLNLSDMSVSSDWTVTLDPGDDEAVASGPPQVGIVFRGSVDAPERSIDVLPFASYLNVRQTERIQKQIEEQQEARLERDRFSRERRKLRDEALARDRAARAAADARATALRGLDDLHDRREIAADARVEAARLAVLAALKAAADKAAAERVAAEAAAGDATARLTLAKAGAEDAKAAVVLAIADEKTAADALATASAALADAETASRDAGAHADEAAALAAAADSAAAEKQNAKAGADGAVGDALAAKAAALATQKAAGEALALADAAKKKADRSATVANAAVAVANTALDAATEAAANAMAARDSAATEKDDAEKAIADAAAKLAAAQDASDRANAERETLAALAVTARGKADVDATFVAQAEGAATAAGSDAAAALKAASDAAAASDKAVGAAKAAAERAAAAKRAAEAAAGEADRLAAAAIERRDGVAAIEAAAASARAAADSAAKLRDDAAASATAAAAEADRLSAESDSRSEVLKSAEAALAAVQAKVDAAENILADATDKALAADSAARAAIGATNAAQDALNSGGGDPAALDAAQRRQMDATMAATEARTTRDAAEANMEALKPDLAAAERSLADAQAAFDALLPAAIAAARKQESLRAAADAAAAEAQAKAKLSAEADRAVDAARVEAAAAEKAAADAAAKKTQADAAFAAAETAAATASAEAEKAAAARAAADKVSAEKSAAHDRALADAVAPRALADRSTSEAVTAEKAAKDAADRATAASSALDEAGKAKTSADDALVAATDRLQEAETDLAARNADVETRKSALAAARSALDEAAAAASDAATAFDAAVARKGEADRQVADANTALDAAQKAAKAIAAEPAGAAAIARKAAAEAARLQALADAAARNVAERTAAMAAAKEALGQATAARAAAERRAADAVTEVAHLEDAAREATADADAKAVEANARMASLQPAAVPLPPLRVDPSPVAEPPVDDVVMGPVTGPLPPLPPMRPAKKKPAARPAAPMVLSPLN